MIGKRICDAMWGWGDVVADEGEFVLVRFDQDPWGLHRIPKEEL